MTKKELSEIILSFGVNNQIIKTCEELGEFQKKLLKYLKCNKADKEELTEEISYCLVMITQIEIIFGIDDDDVLDVMNRKIKKTLDKIRKENEKNVEH